MTYPNHLLVPQFDKGDILTYEFDGASLTIRLPVIPFNRGMINETYPIYNLINPDTTLWNGNPYVEFACQKWTLEDDRNMDDIASCMLQMTLIENTPQQQQEHTLLNQAQSLDLLLSEMTEHFSEPKMAYDPDWPRPENQFKYKAVKRNHLDWHQIQVCIVEGGLTGPAVTIPINNRFKLAIYLHLTSLHGPGRANPFSDEVLRQVGFDLFDELLEHINLQYSPETIALIEKLKQG